jgi:hypothetical protein
MNTEIVNEIRNALKTQINDVIREPIPIIEVNPSIVKNSLTCSGILINATSQSMIIPLDRDIYVVSAEMKWIKDVTSTSLSASISYTNELNVISQLLRAAFLTLTAETGSCSITFPHPIKLQRGSGLTITSSTNVGNISVGAVVSYYTDDSSNA